MTLSKSPTDLQILVANNYVNSLPFGAKRYYARAFLLHLAEGKRRPACGMLSVKHVVEIQAALKELLK